ncbi:Protein HGH1 [Liparis tanakae]|uniref:Protein HGH1 homolog n=1 Tax=Liparis tanakae TaxID=230148 RepID=A0A4Z2H5G1_9TELE|nr:Protein HGH1 [Liparis tanakae]
MLSDTEAEELLGFLSPGTRPDVKGHTTGDGCRFLRSKPDLLVALFALTSDPSIAIVKDCYHVLINLSADETLHQVLVADVKVLPVLLKRLLDPEYPLADQICTILSNLSRLVKTCKTVFKVLQEEVGVARLVDMFCTEGFNKKATLHYLSPLLSNLTQLPEARSCMLDKERCVIQRLFPFTQYRASAVRRGGVVGTLRNCCFDHGETREASLTATRAGRDTLTHKKVYPIMREFHGWEKDVQVSAACEKLVQVLIGDEPEQGMENLMEVEIPEDVEVKLKEADVKEQQELEKMVQEEEEEERKKKRSDAEEAEKGQESGLIRQKFFDNKPDFNTNASSFLVTSSTKRCRITHIDVHVNATRVPQSAESIALLITHSQRNLRRLSSCRRRPSSCSSTICPVGGVEPCGLGLSKRAPLAFSRTPRYESMSVSSTSLSEQLPLSLPTESERMCSIWYFSCIRNWLVFLGARIPLARFPLTLTGRRDTTGLGKCRGG